MASFQLDAKVDTWIDKERDRDKDREKGRDRDGNGVGGKEI